MSTWLILTNLGATLAAATYAAWLLFGVELSKPAISQTPSGIAPLLALMNSTMGGANKDATGTKKTGQPNVRRISPVTERLARSRDPINRYREVTGRRAKVRWWQRVQALLLLALIVTSLGLLLAILIGISFLGATILLETVS